MVTPVPKSWRVSAYEQSCAVDEPDGRFHLEKGHYAVGV